MACNAGFLLTASALLIAACGGQNHRVDVSGNAADLHFTIAGDGGPRLCIDRLTVTPAAAPDGGPIWRVMAVDPTKCITSLRYGESGPAFGEEVRSAPLRTDLEYRVRVSGAGFSLVRDFTVTSAGVQQQAP